jgi:hypothetical protein
LCITECVAHIFYRMGHLHPAAVEDDVVEPASLAQPEAMEAMEPAPLEEQNTTEPVVDTKIWQGV